MDDKIRNRGQKMAACVRNYTSPNMQGIPIRTEEGRKIKETLRRGRPLPDVDFAELEARVLARGAQR